MNLQKCILLIFTLAIGTVNSIAQIHTFKNYGYDEGLSLVSLLTVEESEEGYLWFGTDGAGLMRYDGNSFEYLEELQGRNNRHVNNILFQKNKLLFTTQYRGAFAIENKKVNQISFIKKTGRSRALFYHNNRYIHLRDNSLEIFEDSILINEDNSIAKSSNTHYYGNYILNDNLFIFTSSKNYGIKGKEIFPLHEMLNVDEKNTENIITAYSIGDSLIGIDKKLRKFLILYQEEESEKIIQQGLLLENESVIKSASKRGKIAFITNKGRVIIYEIANDEFRLITNNSGLVINNPTDILIDRNNDIWVTSLTNGAYRISLEPFTMLTGNPLFKNPHIMFIGKTKNENFIISIANKSTFVGKGNNQNDYVENKGVGVTSMTQLEDLTLVSTNKGIYKIEDKQLVEYALFADIQGESVSLITNAFGYIWYSVTSEGLYRKNLETGEVLSFSAAPAYYYNVMSTKDSTALYFGTNYGVTKYDKKTDQLIQIPRKIEGKLMGSYVGNSVMDAHGTIWFSFDNGLLGITKDNKKVVITKKEYLPSLLIYTLNADEYGNLIVGSNKGITTIKVNAQGKAISSRTFNKDNGFYGHETHMRSSFQLDDGSILMGTINGIVLVRPTYFVKKNKLNKPVISSFKNKNIKNLIEQNEPIVLNTEDNNLLIEFKSINTKSNFVTYSYKMEGLQEEWSDWTSKKEAIFNNLQAGIYTFKVKSSINGANESQVSSIRFEIDIPFYKNKWFIIGVIGLLIIINVIILDRTSSFSKKKIILSRDIVADRSIAKSILIIGAVANTLGHMFAARIDDTIVPHDISAIAVGIVIIGLYLIITFIDYSLKRIGFYLALGFLILLGYNLLYTYLSDIHPFYFISALLVTFVAPYTLKKLRSAVFVSLALGVLSVLMMFVVKEAKYNQYLFLMGIAIAGFLMIFKTYLRNNSLEQLIFTAGIVNRGNVLVVAFNKKGKVSFASENIEQLLGMKTSLKNKNVLTLNRFQPPSSTLDSFDNQNLINDFKEGAIFVTPLITENDEVVYYQWSCKQFSDELRIILGQDVTEKINLENYYELIVKNADDLIFQTDTVGNFTFVNQKCSDVFERPKSELLNLSILNLVDPTYQKEVRSFFEENLKLRNKGGYKEFPVLTPDGKTKWLGQNLTTMSKPSAENVVTGCLGLARDITEARKANAIIKEQNKDITSSINYARRIQYNMLPNAEDFEELFKQYFVFYQPKDIVSGDFFWLKKVKDKTVLILSDCTGHGVPGSFMTLLGINILNQVILETKILDPGEILNQLDERLVEVLPRNGENRVQDGMEAIVCVFDNQSNQLEYALAGGRFVIKNNETQDFQVVKDQGKHIGDSSLKENFSYKTHEIMLPKDHFLYLFTDGYPDQFGGNKNKKLTIKRFLSLVEEISQNPMSEQNTVLQNHFKEWMGNIAQTDDITVIGIQR